MRLGTSDGIEVIDFLLPELFEIAPCFVTFTFVDSSVPSSLGLPCLAATLDCKLLESLVRDLFIGVWAAQKSCVILAILELHVALLDWSLGFNGVLNAFVTWVM